MTNFQQYSHKMAEYQLRALYGLDDDTVERKIMELASEHGTVQSVIKISEDSSRRKMFLICFDNTEDAMRAAYALEGRLCDETSVILTLRGKWC